MRPSPMGVLGVAVSVAAAAALVFGAWRAPAPDPVADPPRPVAGSEVGKPGPGFLSATRG